METLSTQFIRTPQVQIVSTVHTENAIISELLQKAEVRRPLYWIERTAESVISWIYRHHTSKRWRLGTNQHSIHTSIATPIRSQPRRLLFLDDTLDTLVGACWVSIWIMQCTSNLPMPCWIGFKGTPLVNILGLVLPFSKECKLCRSYHIQWRSENRPRIGYSC